MSSLEVTVKLTLPRSLFAPEADKVSKVAGQIFKERGYIVIGYPPGTRSDLIGLPVSNIWGYDTNRKFVITEKTTSKDMEDQMKRVGSASV